MKTTILLKCLLLAAAFTAQAQFIKYEGNPVLRLGTAGSWESKQVSHPRILFDGKLYRMWYAGSNDTSRQIGYATSVDGINWAKHPANPVLKIGERDNLDGMVVSPGAVLFDGRQYHMYYTARSFANAGTICHATSPEGISWTKDTANNPILKKGAPGWWDDFGLSAGPVLKQGTTWKMWYNGFRSDTRWYTGLAVSSDGVHWTKDTLNNPLLEFGAPGTWDEYEQWIADVLPDSLYYEAFYFGNAKQRAIGYAVSRDGVAWAKYEGNPILAPESSTDEKAVLFQSSVLKTSYEYKIWYSDGLKAQICFATSGAAFTPASAQEQEKRMLAENKPVASETKLPPQARIKIPEAPKIIGERNFDVDLKDGVLTFARVKKGAGTVTMDIDLGELKLNIPTNAEIKQRIYTTGGDGVFLIFESGILAAFPEPNRKGTFAYTSVSDGSKIFNHQGATFLSEDGSALATTPTTLLVLNPNNKDVIAVTYKTLFGDVPPLVMPVFSQGKDKNHVDLRDEVIKDGEKQVKVTLTLDKFKAEVLPDAIAMR
jgi:predicted GH43/DUF377 family glycosyl hydrolase